MDTSYLFIDGGCLRATIRNIADRYFGGKQLEIDYVRLKGNHKKAFYYDAIPAIKIGESEIEYAERIKSRIKLHNHIATLPGYHVYEGDSRIRRKQVQQKEVDVMIAVDMLTHTFRKNMDKATFIASDIDFKPLLDALVREGMFLELRYPPSDTNQDLVNAADHRTPLAVDTIYPFLDRESQALIEIPVRSLHNRQDFEILNEKLITNHPALGDIFYIYNDDKHKIFWVHSENIDQFMVVYASDYDIIRKYVQDLFIISLPDNIED